MNTKRFSRPGGSKFGLRFKSKDREESRDGDRSSSRSSGYERRDDERPRSFERRNDDRSRSGGFQRRDGARPGAARFGRDKPSFGRERAPRAEFRKPTGPLVQVKKFNCFEREFDRKNIYTKNLTPGRAFFSEQLVTDNGEEYRTWDCSRSKLAAGIKKGLSQIGIKEGDTVLYLGASHGFTPSFVSDMIGPNGSLFCLDVAPRVVRDLVFVCEARENMAPLLSDANHPENYKHLISKHVDVVFQDISQRNQVQIFLKNCDEYLKSGGFGLLALKARSIDVTMNPRDIYAIVRQQLEAKITIVDYKELDPFERDHAIFVCKKK